MSLRQVGERLQPYFDNHGSYTVKLRYHVARLTDGNTCNPTTHVVLVGKEEAPGREFGRPKSPPKVRSFIWRLCREVLQTKVVRAHKFPIHDMNCAFCLNEVETGMYIFTDCPVMRLFWTHNPLYLRS